MWMHLRYYLCDLTAEIYHMIGEQFTLLNFVITFHLFAISVFHYLSNIHTLWMQNGYNQNDTHNSHYYNWLLNNSQRHNSKVFRNFWILAAIVYSLRRVYNTIEFAIRQIITWINCDINSKMKKASCWIFHSRHRMPFASFCSVCILVLLSLTYKFSDAVDHLMEWTEKSNKCIIKPNAFCFTHQSWTD